MCQIICCISADWASVIVNLITGVFIAFILAFIVPRKLTNERTLKDFFIGELKSFNTDYNYFHKQMCLGELNSKKIVETYKQFNIRLNEIEKAVNKRYKVNTNLNTYFFIEQCFVTATEEINSNFSAKNVSFTHSSNRQILSNQCKFNKETTSVIVSINDARSRKHKS